MAPAAKVSEYPKRRISGMAIFDMADADAVLAPDMAPKIPQAKTVAIPNPPRTLDNQLCMAVYKSLARPPHEEK